MKTKHHYFITLLINCLFSTNLFAQKPIPIALYNFYDFPYNNQMENAFEVYDISGNGNNLITIDAGTPARCPGIRDAAAIYYRGNALAAYHNSTLNMGEGDFSFSCWVKTICSATRNTIIDKRTIPELGYHFLLENGKPCVQIANGVPDIAGKRYTNYFADPTVNDGVWHHIIISVDRDNPNGIKFYIDGQTATASSDNSNPTNRTGNLDNTMNLLVGYHVSLFDSHFEGMMDELAIFNTAITPTNVVELFNYNIPMRAYFNFNPTYEPIEPNTNDIAGFSNPGILFGNPTPQFTQGVKYDGNHPFYYAFTFNGQNYIRVDNSDQLNIGSSDFSISCWINTQSTKSMSSIIDKRDGTKGYNLALNYSLTKRRLILQIANGTGYTNFTWSSTFFPVKRKLFLVSYSSGFLSLKI